jgi:hypothetical protein
MLSHVCSRMLTYAIYMGQEREAHESQGAPANKGKGRRKGGGQEETKKRKCEDEGAVQESDEEREDEDPSEAARRHHKVHRNMY